MDIDGIREFLKENEIKVLELGSQSGFSISVGIGLGFG